MHRVLIFAEAVTLAHVARPVALARILRAAGHDVRLAVSSIADRWLRGENVSTVAIRSIAPQRFEAALARGIPAYDAATIREYVADDLEAIDAYRPDVVIGDFRLSLYISARLRNVRYGALANAYWTREFWPGAEMPSIGFLGSFARFIHPGLFDRIAPIAFAAHAMPFVRACKHFGVASPRLDIRDVYTASDYTGYVDAGEFYGRDAGDPQFLGPLAWTPHDTGPELPNGDGAPIVFVAAGSSGARTLLAASLDALARLPVRVIVATGNASSITPPGNCVHWAPFVSYERACSVASVVVCNGGSPATYHALAAGVPYLALPANLDQFLNARALVPLGAGRIVRADAATSDRIEQALHALLGEPRHRDAAQAAKRIVDRYDPKPRIAAWIDGLAGTGKPHG